MWLSLTILSAFLWAVIHVGNSVIVARYVKEPTLILWVQGAMSLLFLLLIASFFSVKTSQAPLLFLGGSIMYGGDLLFLWILDRLDVSVMNAAWAILAVLLSIVGFLFFNESWTVFQTTAVGFVLFGVFFVSFFYAHVSLPHTVGLLTILALFYLAANILRKASVASGVPVVSVMFWLIIGRDLFGFLIPLLVPSKRQLLFSRFSGLPPQFILLSLFLVACFYAAEYAITAANRTGQISLISVAGNTQMFFIILLAWFLIRFFPRLAPRETLEIHDIFKKMVGFIIVFVGLALLALF